MTAPPRAKCKCGDLHTVPDDGSYATCPECGMQFRQYKASRRNVLRRNRLTEDDVVRTREAGEPYPREVDRNA